MVRSPAASAVNVVGAAPATVEAYVGGGVKVPSAARSASAIAASVIVSPEFEGMRSIKRHQRVFATLGARMKTDEVHALSIHALTPAEWEAAQKG